MLLPLVDAPELGYDAALPTAFLDEIRRIGVSGQVVLLLPVQTRSSRGIAYLKPLLRVARCMVGPFLPSEAEAATAFLDNGAVCAYFDVNASGREGSVVAVADALSSLPRDRLGIFVHCSDGGAAADDAAAAPSSSGAPSSYPRAERLTVAAISALKNLVGTVLVAAPAIDVSKDWCDAVLAASGSPHAQVVVVPANGSVVRPEDVARLHRHELHVAHPAVISPPETARQGEDAAAAAAASAVDLGSCVAACARTDRHDGLLATVVSDELGKTLGLVYSSKESIAEAIRCGRGVYYSRSRGSLWRKGDTSGAWQALLSIRLDCDSDALLFTVRQMGNPAAFCHLNSRNCWGEDGGLSALERTLFARKEDAPAGSYTKRLFDDPELLKNKLLEEAQELSEASHPDDVAAEAADIIYFALVACARAGVHLSDIEKHLDRRALKVRRRTGDAKPERIAAANAHFDAAASKVPAAPTGNGSG